MNVFASFIVLLALTAPPVPEPGTGEHLEHIRWLENNSIPIRSLDIKENDDFADLAPIANHIGDARIVLLGEQTHGDGAAFLAKARLIAFLHEEMGFDVLCFESGIYSCSRAWDLIEDGTHTREAIDQAVFPIWTRSAQFDELLNYVEQRARTDNPLEITGYDCQLSGSLDREIPDLFPRIIDTLAEHATEDDERLVEFIKQFWRGERPDPEEFTGLLASLEDRLRDPDLQIDATQKQRDWWAQLAQSLAGLVRHVSMMQDESLSMPERFNPRDEQGARNMLWLANERFEGRKIIVWGASMHFLRDHSSIETGMENLDYEGLRSMGDHISEVLGDEVYIIAPTTYAGRAGRPGQSQWIVTPAQEGSFEHLCKESGLLNAFVPLRDRADAPFLDGELVARPLGNAPMTARWPRHLDAFLFQREMSPSTLLEAPPAQQVKPAQQSDVEPADVLQSIKSEAERYRQRARDGHAFGEKGDFNDEWDKWVRDAEPTLDEMKEAVEAIVEWGDRQLEDPVVGYRVHLLYAHLAHSDDDIDDAIDQVDLALDAYTPRAHTDPQRHSARQHIVNRRAMLTWERDGFDAALTWTAERLENDPDFLYFYSYAWLQLLEQDPATAVERAQLIRDVIDDAYRSRIESDPAHADTLQTSREDTRRSLEGWLDRRR